MSKCSVEAFSKSRWCAQPKRLPAGCKRGCSGSARHHSYLHTVNKQGSAPLMMIIIAWLRTPLGSACKIDFEMAFSKIVVRLLGLIL